MIDKNLFNIMWETIKDWIDNPFVIAILIMLVTLVIFQIGVGS